MVSTDYVDDDELSIQASYGGDGDDDSDDDDGGGGDDGDV